MLLQHTPIRVYFDKLYWIVSGVCVCVAVMVPSVCMNDTRLNAFFMRLDIVHCYPFNCTQNEMLFEWCYRLLTLLLLCCERQLFLLVVIIILFLLWKIHSANNYLSLIWWFWMNICYVYTHIFGVLSKQLHFVFSISGFGHEMVAFVHPFHMNTNQLNGSLYFHTLHWCYYCTLDTYNPHNCDCCDF